MTVQDIIASLKQMSSEKYKNNVIKLGIPPEYSIGVPTGELRKMAKQIGKSKDLALALWESGYHEAKLLAILLMDHSQITAEQIQWLMSGVQSWDLCDHLCKNLIIKMPDYQQWIGQWCDSPKLYEKRAAYSLMASALIYDHNLSMAQIEAFLALIEHHSADDRLHVKKAISWALREIGKKDVVCQEKALLLAYQLKDSGLKSQSWIGKDAIKELETLVQVEGRQRLITTDSQMGQQA